MATVSVLGPVVVTDGESSVHIGGPRQRRLLAALLISEGQPVSVAALVDAVFGDRPPLRAPATLRTYVTRLRHVLPDGIDVVAEPPGYALRTRDPAASDAVRFREAVVRGQRLLAHEEHAEAAAVFAGALSLWRGRPFDDVADNSWAAAEVRRLEQARTSCREGLIDALSAAGRVTEALPVAAELIEADPFNESHRLRHARALYRAGQANEALEAIRSFRELLADELGIHPTPELESLHLSILRNDPDLGSVRRVRGYLIGERLGSGASGPVHAARRAGSDTPYAVRVYPAALADDPGFVRTFAEDVRRLANRSHPALVPVHDAWREPGVAYLVMRRLTGGTLTERLGRGRLSPDQVSALEERISAALRAARDAGVRHGRLTTDAVLYGADGLPYLADLALGESELRDGDDDADLAALMAAAGARDDVPPIRGSTNPYVGLRAFDTTDAAVFHGREAQVEALVRRVAGDTSLQRFTLLVGPSGCGKSSVVRAGLIARMSTAPGGRWRVAIAQPGARPFKELAEALRRVATRASSEALADLTDGRASMMDAVGTMLGDGDRLLVVIDQLEELFTQPDERVTSFLTSLAATVHSEPRVSVVATLRADHYDRPLRLPEVGRLLQDATVVVPPLDDEERRRAIVEPARAAGLAVDDTVLTELLRGSRDSLPALQFALFELAERGDGRLRADDLEALGGLDGAIAHRAETLVTSLDAGGPPAVRALFRQLVALDEQGNPARRRAPLAEVLTSPDAPAPEVVQCWVDARLLTTDHEAETREPVVQIAHEALLVAWPRLRGWVEEERDWLRLASQARSAARDWDTLGRDDDALWRGARLDRADDLLGTEGLPDLVGAFLGRSREVRAAERTDAAEREAETARTARRIHRQRSGLAAALVVVVIAAALAWQQRQDAVDSARQAEDRARAATLGLVAAAAETRTEDWPRSLLLAVEAQRLDDSARTQEALLATLSNPGSVPTPVHTASTALVALAVDADTGALVMKDADGAVAVVAADGAVRHSAFATPPSFHRGGLAVAGGLVVSAGIEDRRPGVVVHDIGDGSRVGALRTARGEVPDVAFGPEGSRFAISGDSRVRIVDAGSFRVVRSLRHPDGHRLISVHWAADGNLLYAGSEGGDLAAWDLTDASTDPMATSTVVDGAPVVDLDEMADGRILVAATFDSGTMLLDPRTLRVTAGPLGADNAVLGVSVDGSGTELAVAASSRVDRWQVYAGRAPDALDPVGGGAAATYTGPGELLTGGLDGSVTSWQLHPEVPGLISLDELGVGNPRFDPTGHAVAMWGFGGGVRLYDASRLTQIATLPFDDPEQTSFSGIAFNPDGSRVAALWCRGPSHVFDAPCDGRIGVYDAATGALVAGPEPTGQLAPWVGTAITWSADGAWLATGHIDGSVEVRHPGDLRVETTLTDLAGGEGFVTEVDFSDDPAAPAALVATTGTDAATWSVPDWERLGRIRVGVTAHFAPDGRLVTSDQDGTVRLRDRTLAVLATYRGLPSPATRPAFAGDGARFATLDDFTGVARIWRTDPLAPIGGPLAVIGRSSGVTVSPDGTRVLVGGERTWELRLDPDRWAEQACTAAGRNLTSEEWATYLGDEPYRRTCPEFPTAD